MTRPSHTHTKQQAKLQIFKVLLLLTAQAHIHHSKTLMLIAKFVRNL
jgi:hypothetical protein